MRCVVIGQATAQCRNRHPQRNTLVRCGRIEQRDIFLPKALRVSGQQLEGIGNRFECDQPTLIVETFAADVEKFLLGFGYRVKQIPGSSNKIFSTTDIDIH